jgi:hypothetical protein
LLVAISVFVIREVEHLDKGGADSSQLA